MARVATGLPGFTHITALVRRASEGDRTAFDKLVGEYQTGVKGFVALRVEQTEIDDVTQEIWMTCWSRLPALKNHRSFKAWLYGIAVNKCYEAHRGRSKKQQTTSIDEIENVPIAGPAIEEQFVLRDTVKRSLESLPVEQRDVIELYYFSQLTLPEIAQSLMRNLNTVKYQFYRGHASIAAVLSGTDDALPSKGLGK